MAELFVYMANSTNSDSSDNSDNSNSSDNSDNSNTLYPQIISRNLNYVLKHILSI